MKKTTRRALFLSFASMFLCFTMLLGTTYAWFTDSVESGVNKIVAGNLDVELYNDKTTTSGKEVTRGTKLFDLPAGTNGRWEPGVAVYENFTIANLGDLALKYQFGVEIAKKNGEKNLADVLKVAVVDPIADGADRETIIASVGKNNWKPMESFVETGKLYPNGYSDPNAKETIAQTKSFAIVIWWEPSDKDNDYNMKNGAAQLQLEIGVNLYATQLEAEDDSFGKDYDKDAWHDKFEVTSAADLQAALNNGETNIVLADNITVTEPLVVGAVNNMSDADDTIVIDLNGNTITAAYNETTGKHSYAIDNYGSLVIVGGTIEARGIYNRDGATTTVNGTKIVNLDMNGGSCIWSYGGSVYLNNATLVGYTGCVYSEGYLEINGGTYTCYSAVTDDGEQIGPTYNIRSTGELVINGGDFTSRHGLLAIKGSAEINGGTYTMTSIGVITSHVFYVYGDSSNVVVNDGAFNCDLRTAQNNGSSMICVDAANVAVNVYGGTFNLTPAKYVADGYEVTNNGDGTWTVAFPQKSFDKLFEGVAAGDTVKVPAGTYTFPASSIKEGMTIQCAPGTVFEGTSGLNINGATVIGATFSNEGGQAVSGTINGTFKDCVFEGEEALRWCYSREGETVIFENCVIKTDFRGFHFDDVAGNIIFRNCEINGFNAYGGAGTVTFEGCTFGNDESRYNGLNIYANTVLTNCTFNYISGKTNFVDYEAAGKSLTITNCTATLDGEAANLLDFVGGTYKSQTTIIVDGAYYATTNDQFKAAVAAGATEIWLANGEYDLNGNQKDGLKIVGVGNDVKMANTTKYASGKATGAIWQAINLENVTLTNTVYTMADGGKATFTNVTFAAGFRQGYGTGVVFTNCTFGANSEGYALHFQTDSASEGGIITLNGCEFEGGKVHLGGKRAYTFTGCDFAAGTDFQVWSNITLDGCTVDGVEVTADNAKTFFTALDANYVSFK